MFLSAALAMTGRLRPAESLGNWPHTLKDDAKAIIMALARATVAACSRSGHEALRMSDTCPVDDRD
jgi:hypothetical protein